VSRIISIRFSFITTHAIFKYVNAVFDICKKYVSAVTSGGERASALFVMKSKNGFSTYIAISQCRCSKRKGRTGWPLTWAPKLWHLDDAWYIYTCATDGINNHTHRVIILKRTYPQEPFKFASELKLGDFYSIDASVLNAPNGNRYLLR
jgi:hypothetical protein